MERPPFAGTSPAPKQGPQKAVRSTTPACMRSAAAPLRVSARNCGWEAGYTLMVKAPEPMLLPRRMSATVIMFS